MGFLTIIWASGLASAASQPTWIELRSPNFIVVTNASEAQARRTDYQFEMIRAVFRTYFGQTQDSVEQPVIIVAAKDENTLKGLLPEYWAQKGTAHPSGMYVGGTDADYIALRLDVGLNQETYEPFEPVYHEYVHYLTRQLLAKAPLWVVEGLAEFYGNTRIRGKDVYVGAPSTSNLITLHRQQLLPVSTLVEIDASSPYYHEHDKTSIFYSESWALTHYLLARDWKEHTSRMSQFLHLLATGVDAKDAASRTIGNATALDDPLRKYINSYSFTAAKIQSPKIEESGFRVREISDARALAVRADFVAHRGRYAEAQRMLEEALKADPKLDVAYDGLSFLALQQGEAGEAEKWSSQALLLDPQDYRANYYYAWSLIKGGHLEEQSLARAEASLRAVTTGNPEFVPAYDAMAYVLEQEGGKEKLEEAFSMAQQAVSREPGNVYYRIRAVEVLERQRRSEDAVRVATLAVSMAKTAAEGQAASAALAGALRLRESGEQTQAIESSPPAGGKVSPAGLAPTTGARGLTNQVTVAVRVVLLSNPQGVDFNSYLSENVIPKIQREWSVQIQKVRVTAAANAGTVILEFSIERDGSIAEMKLQRSTQEQVLDEAVRGAIQAASPFAALPTQFRGKDIAVRFECDYNPTAPGGETQGTAVGDTKKGPRKTTEN